MKELAVQINNMVYGKLSTRVYPQAAMNGFTQQKNAFLWVSWYLDEWMYMNTFAKFSFKPNLIQM